MNICPHITPLRTALAGSLLVVLFLCGCKAPSVNLATEEPIKLDIEMRLDVYQHDQTKKDGNATKPSTTATAETPSGNPKTSRDNRLVDVQQFKQKEFVGEGSDGLLAIRWEVVNKENESDRQFIRDTVKAENADRLNMMKDLAETEKRPLPEIQAKQAEIWRNRAFKGEWIQSPTAGGATEWIKKEG